MSRRLKITTNNFTKQELKEIVCALKIGHIWERYKNVRDNIHYRICLKCEKRELDHNDGQGVPNWCPTTYGTPAWNKIGI